MFAISIESRFEASHQLTLPDGLKESTHRHNWLVTAEISSDRLNNMAVVMDFRQLKAEVDEIVFELDGKPLEKIEYFQQNNPSAENVAKYIYERLKLKLPKGLKLQNVSVIEQPGFSAKFSE